ncbi:hypothetical protein PHJA_002878800 [Phtheirospermum japonicum]|uniref:Uncharacterized protein n=1 Tax=Phtheirospermum japonicum TaxID=374723 RepID=A0A830D6L5_9LAMI|nr:hypothetical protein PHJA_002878800 [Phtheirospermum japonicum]
MRSRVGPPILQGYECVESSRSRWPYDDDDYYESEFIRVSCTECQLVTAHMFSCSTFRV